MYHDEILKPTRFRGHSISTNAGLDLNVVPPILTIKIHTEMPIYIYIYIDIYNSYMRMPLQMHVLRSCIYFNILNIRIYI